MNRRSLITLAAAVPVAAAMRDKEQQPTSRLGDLVWNATESAQLGPSETYVDGKRVRLVWYVNYTQGIVRTYDVFGDGEIWRVRSMHDEESRLNSRIVQPTKRYIKPELYDGHLWGRPVHDKGPWRWLTLDTEDESVELIEKGMQFYFLSRTLRGKVETRIL